jgi:hypothetical protein
MIPILFIMDLFQFGVTCLYSILYYKCKFVLAHYRANKKKDEEQNEEDRKKKLEMGGAVVEEEYKAEG